METDPMDTDAIETDPLETDIMDTDLETGTKAVIKKKINKVFNKDRSATINMLQIVISLLACGAKPSSFTQ
jgi:hypothetical protein